MVLVWLLVAYVTPPGQNCTVHGKGYEPPRPKPKGLRGSGVAAPLPVVPARRGKEQNRQRRAMKVHFVTVVVGTAKALIVANDARGIGLTSATIPGKVAAFKDIATRTNATTYLASTAATLLGQSRLPNGIRLMARCRHRYYAAEVQCSIAVSTGMKRICIHARRLAWCATTFHDGENGSVSGASPPTIRSYTPNKSN
jgi:hypothetical protein